MNRDELEASMWLVLKTFGVSCDNPVGLIDQIVALATSYGAGDGPEVTAARRAVLEREGGSDELASVAASRSPMPLGGGSLTGQSVTVARATNPQAVDIPQHADGEVTV